MPRFVVISGNFGGEVSVNDDVLLSHEREVYPTALFDENCVQFDCQTDLNYYADSRQSYLALKLLKVGGYETYNSKEVGKGHKRMKQWRK